LKPEKPNFGKLAGHSRSEKTANDMLNRPEHVRTLAHSYSRRDFREVAVKHPVGTVRKAKKIKTALMDLL